jgi:hypothetical protein
MGPVHWLYVQIKSSLRTPCVKLYLVKEKMGYEENKIAPSEILTSSGINILFSLCLSAVSFSE